MDIKRSVNSTNVWAKLEASDHKKKIQNTQQGI